VSFLSAVVSQIYIDEELLSKNVSFESLGTNSQQLHTDTLSAIHLPDIQSNAVKAGGTA
jgi:hypothetical protein